MFEMTLLIVRNIKIFIRDKTTVFFSFLSVIILLGLYLLFLKNAYHIEFLDQVMTPNQLDFMVNSMLMGGVLVINTTTLSLGNLGNIVNDFEDHKIDAFIITPIQRIKIILSYLIASILITLVFTLLMWFLTILIVGLSTQIWYRMDVILKTTGLLVLYTFISTSIMILLITYIKSTNAFGAISGILGTVIGFMSGIYLPLSQLPQNIQVFSTMLPYTHMTIYLKRVMMTQSFEILSNKIPKEAMQEIQQGYTIAPLPVLGYHLDPVWILCLCILLSILCIFCATIRLMKRIKH